MTLIQYLFHTGVELVGVFSLMVAVVNQMPHNKQLKLVDAHLQPYTLAPMYVVRRRWWHRL